MDPIRPIRLITLESYVLSHLDYMYGSARGLEQLNYHNRRHTLWVGDRALHMTQLLEAWHPDFTQRDTELFKIAQLFHDFHQITYVDWTANPAKRIRRPGLSERASADEALSWMGKHGRYTSQEMAIVEHSILATQAEWSDEYQTVIHPLLQDDSPLIARVLVLADVNGSGLDISSDSTIEDSLRLLLENHPLFPTRTQWVGGLPPEQIKSRLKAAHDWLKLQQGFIAGRQQRLETEIAPFGPARDQIRPLFRYFDRTLVDMRHLYERVEHLELIDFIAHNQLWKYT